MNLTYILFLATYQISESERRNNYTGSVLFYNVCLMDLNVVHR